MFGVPPSPFGPALRALLADAPPPAAEPLPGPPVADASALTEFWAIVDGDFKVGVGSDSYTTSFGKPAHVVCGHDNPCALVLKLQYPEHFGFFPIPLTFQ